MTTPISRDELRKKLDDDLKYVFKGGGQLSDGTINGNVWHSIQKQIDRLIDSYVADQEALTSAERAELEMYRHQHQISLEDYHEYGKAPVGSPERMVAYVSYLSLHNLPQGAEMLREWRDSYASKIVAHITKAINGLYNPSISDLELAERQHGDMPPVIYLGQANDAIAALSQLTNTKEDE
jgi:hypothetical protein